MEANGPDQNNHYPVDGVEEREKMGKWEKGRINNSYCSMFLGAYLS